MNVLLNSRKHLDTHHNNWMPFWKLKAKMLHHTLLSRELSIGADERSTIPHIVCESKNAWEDFPTLINRALKHGSKKFGGFTVRLHPSVDGYEWKGIKSHPYLKHKFSEANFGETGTDGVFSAHLQPQRAFQFDLRRLQSWPHHKISMNDIVQAWDLMDSEVRSASKRPLYAVNVDANEPHDRTKIGLDVRSPLGNLQNNRIMRQPSKLRGIHSPEAFISSPGFGAPFTAHEEDWELGAINVLIIGGGKLWCFIPESQAVKFETFMARVFKCKPLCGQFVRHKGPWPSRKALEREGIEYFLAWQQQHEVVVTHTRVYHWGFNVDANLAEARNFAEDTWAPRDAYEQCNRSCGTEQSKFIRRRDVEIPAEVPERAQACGEPESSNSASQGCGPGERSTLSAEALGANVSTEGSMGQGKIQHRERGRPRAATSTTTNVSTRQKRPLQTAVNPKSKRRRHLSPKEMSAVSKSHVGVPDRLRRNSNAENPKEKAGSNTVSAYLKAEGKWINNEAQTNSWRSRDREHVIRLISSAASAEAIRFVQDAIRAWREGSDTAEPKPESSAGKRFIFLRGLLMQTAHLGLLKRCHQVALAKDLASRGVLGGEVTEDRFILSTANKVEKQKPTSKRRGNPRNAAKSRDINIIMEQAYPDMKDNDPRRAALYAEAKVQRIVGMRWNSLVEIYGTGILGVFPTTTESHFTITDSM